MHEVNLTKLYLDPNRCKHLIIKSRTALELIQRLSTLTRPMLQQHQIIPKINPVKLPRKDKNRIRSTNKILPSYYC